jgi:hypothetical protein
MNDTICNHKLTPRGRSRSLCPFVKIFANIIYGKNEFIYLFILHHMPMEEN